MSHLVCPACRGSWTAAVTRPVAASARSAIASGPVPDLSQQAWKRLQVCGGAMDYFCITGTAPLVSKRARVQFEGALAEAS